MKKEKSTTQAILETLSYFDIFDHPLKMDEIHRFLPCLSSDEEIKNTLFTLEAQRLIYQYGGYYSISSQIEPLVSARKEKEALAVKMRNKAIFFSRIIGAFPFVESVCISGSLSKGVIAKDGDIDFFVITSPNRLWICRTFLILFKKIFLLNSHKYFCPNYFIDTEHLPIPDRNIFTATEINSLVPVMNYQLYVDFMRRNDWCKVFLPNSGNRNGEYARPKRNGILKGGVEFILSGKLGEYLDDLFFRITLRRWKRKFAHFDTDEFDLRLRTRKNVSKHHPRGYQHKVLTAYEERTKYICQQLKERPNQAA